LDPLKQIFYGEKLVLFHVTATDWISVQIKSMLYKTKK